MHYSVMSEQQAKTFLMHDTVGIVNIRTHLYKCFFFYNNIQENLKFDDCDK